MSLPAGNTSDHLKLHILLDLETLSTKSNAAVSEIAAISLESGASFSSLIAPSELPQFDVNSDTVEWHDQQKEGRNYLEFLNLRGSFCTTVANDFITWLHQQAGDRRVILWTQGTDFDIPILRNLLSFSGLEFPCRHDDVRDFRTVAKLFPEIKYTKGNHSALDDVAKMHIHFQKLLNASPLLSSYVFGKD